MLRRVCSFVFLIVAWLNVAPAVGKVLLRIAADPMPAAQAMGVSEIVLSWPVRDTASFAKLRALGFRVFLEADTGNIAAAATEADGADLAGVIVNATIPDSSANGETIRSARRLHPQLLFRLLIADGKQPQMRGRLVVNRDGILQVSSPSAQPWLDTNLAAVRLAQTFNPDSVSVLYDFHWALSGTLHKELGPSAEEYALAISEADAIRADAILDLPESLQKALATDQPAAWSLWNHVKPYLAFSSISAPDEMRPVANIGIVTCDAQSNYEAVNLLARHNLAFEIAGPRDLLQAQSSRWNTLLVFCSPQNNAISSFYDFAKCGGVVVMVNQPRDYPWHSNAPSKQDAHLATFSVGTGEIVEVRGPVTDPETFARDLRRLIGPQRSALGLWNSLTTLVTGYRLDSTGETTLNVINYADLPDNVQVQIRGRFTSVQLESPEVGCCRTLQAFEHNGFTEFTIPRLTIAARVHLKSADISPANH